MKMYDIDEELENLIREYREKIDQDVPLILLMRAKGGETLESLKENFKRALSENKKIAELIDISVFYEDGNFSLLIFLTSSRSEK